MFYLLQLNCSDDLCQLAQVAFFSILIIALWELLALVGAKHKISIGLAALSADESRLRLLGLVFLFRALRDVIVYRLHLFLKGKRIENIEDGD
jgi:hypothetical protein